MNHTNLNFINKNLQNLSFQGQNLDGANFSQADIRGCNFSNASLQRANFENAKAGQTPKILICLIFFALITTIIIFQAVSQMIFGVISRTPESPIWGYAVALSISLGIAGTTCTLMSLAREKSTLQRISTILSGTTSGAILGFFYGGTAAGGKNPPVAIASAVIGALIMAITSVYFKGGFIKIILSVAGTFSTYGFAFLIGIRAIVFLSTQNLIWGFSLICFSLTYIGLTVINLRNTVKQITTYSVTSFRGSDLTNANLKNAKLGLSDFTNAIGVE